MTLLLRGSGQHRGARARTACRSAVKQLSDLNIVSPIDGFVSVRATDPGQIADAGVALITIVDLHTVYFQPTVSDIAISEITAGQHVQVAVDSFPGKTFDGIVSAVFPAASLRPTRTFAIQYVDCQSKVNC